MRGPWRRSQVDLSHQRGDPGGGEPQSGDDAGGASILSQFLSPKVEETVVEFRDGEEADRPKPNMFKHPTPLSVSVHHHQPVTRFSTLAAGPHVNCVLGTAMAGADHGLFLLLRQFRWCLMLKELKLMLIEGIVAVLMGKEGGKMWGPPTIYSKKA
ncbi:hypothetical protein BCR33DRAFT_727392 [Rhizoclosmatium globosum]|uniref:Uncharacterized protein n=1 Tax=Rhizoclosmatium globosum TaxID=329046 RepID=A0A1Y2APW4_9FUNG|nr:hypothetical protein BCR33DRAFT_727392 [Rhizoclosmatium globosum]|eukprot:ORY24536.1 hypothetical protein BCR33DRAFT_727392 [Rhizoclosmatium globosum]